jgi:TorA maturation chaperone TorD
MHLTDRIDTASARNHTYILVSRLFLDGLTVDLLPYVEKIPELAIVYSQPFDPEEAAVDHHRIFSFDIFPYESIFRDPSGLVGGAYSTLVQGKYEQSAFRQSIDSDHIGYELAFLAYLCSEEAAMLANKQVAEAERSTQLQQQFLRDHLLCWLFPFVNALNSSGQPFFAALGQLTLQLVYDHILQLGNYRGRWKEQPDSYAGHTLPESPDILQENQAGLKQVSRFLLTPPFSGLYLSRSAITKLARHHQIPRGFGDRQQLLANLLRAAGQYDVAPELLQELTAITKTWKQAYENQRVNYPEIESWIRPWQQRVAETENSLVQMSNMIRTAA